MFFFLFFFTTSAVALNPFIFLIFLLKEPTDIRSMSDLARLSLSPLSNSQIKKQILIVAGIYINDYIDLSIFSFFLFMLINRLIALISVVFLLFSKDLMLNQAFKCTSRTAGLKVYSKILLRQSEIPILLESF